jgi:hypothetical protein
VVPMQAGSAVRAAMPADGEALMDHHPTARTGLAGECRRHRYDGLASCYRFARQDGQEATPARITDALSEMVVPHHVGRLYVFVIDRVVRSYQRQRCLMVEVYPLPAYPLMRSGEQPHCLLATTAALLAPSDAPLGSP